MLTKEQECELVLNTQWEDLDEIEQIQEKLSNGPIWRCYKAVDIDLSVEFEYYMLLIYDYECPVDESDQADWDWAIGEYDVEL